MILQIENTKYTLKGLAKFKKQLKKVLKQGKDINKLIEVLAILANGMQLDDKYRDHSIVNDNYFKDCRECHIENDWLLIYKYDDENLILFMVQTGSHSELFKK